MIRLNDVRERFELLDREGHSAAEIASILKVSSRSVVRWRRKLERSHGAPFEVQPVEVRAHALSLITDGCSLRETARTVGVADMTVARWFPDAPRWTRAQSAEFAALCRREARDVG